MPERTKVAQLATANEVSSHKKRLETYGNIIIQHLVGDAVVSKHIVVHGRAGDNSAGQEAEESAYRQKRS
jgi:hypothetical protein